MAETQANRVKTPAGPGGETAPQERGVTLRAILFGLCIATLIGPMGDAVRYILHASFMAYSHMPMGNLILYLLSTLILAPLAWWFGKRFAFSPSEWITIFCMGFIASMGPTYGISGYLVGLMVGPYYFATPENEWSKYLQPYMPHWLIPTNDGSVMTWFYEGLPQGVPIPWNIWAVPLFWWFTFICAVGFVCACAAILLRRQWSENERLVYPAMEPIIEMTTRVGRGTRFFPEYMQGKAFWIGFALTTFVFGWNMISWAYPQFPRFPTAYARWTFFSRDYPPALFFLSTVVICFSYFASLEILFSIWFFDLLFIVEGGILNRLGVRAISPYYGTGRYYWQTSGAFFSLALWGVWVARLHFADVFRKALHPEKSTLDDSKELLSYRGALIGLIVGCLYIAVWLNRVGMELKMIALLIPSMLLVYTTVAKILADSGLIYVNSPLSGWGLAVRLLGGSHTLTILTRATLGLSSRVINHYRGFAMGSLAHINRLAEFVPRDKRRLFWSVCAAFVIGMVTSTLFTIWLGYTIGGYNIRPNWLIIRSAMGQIGGIANAAKTPSSPIEITNYWFFLIGAGAMACLNLMRYRFVWWPIHPIGFALSGTALSRLTSVTIFVAWLVKLVMLKLVGAAFYRKSRAFFIGMLIGYILQVTLGLVVDTIWFQPQGHRVHKWY